MTEQEMLHALRTILVQTTTLYQAIARAPALTFAKDTASAPAYADSELKKIIPSRRTARAVWTA